MRLSPLSASMCSPVAGSFDSVIEEFNAKPPPLGHFHHQLLPSLPAVVATVTGSSNHPTSFLSGGEGRGHFRPQHEVVLSFVRCKLVQLTRVAHAGKVGLQLPSFHGLTSAQAGRWQVSF